jgi:hypothetical protein
MSVPNLDPSHQRAIRIVGGFSTLFSLRNGDDKEVDCTPLAQEALSPKPPRSPHFSFAARLAGVDGPSAFKAVVRKATTVFREAKESEVRPATTG